MYSIRNKLTLSIIVGMVVVLSMTTMLLYYLIAREAQTVFDTALLDKARAMISLTELDAEDGLEFDFTEGIMPEFEAEFNAQYYQVWELGIDPLLKSPSLAGQDLPRLETKLGEHQFADLDLADGRSGRLIAINFLPRLELEDDEVAGGSTDQQEIPVPQPLTLVLARERETLDRMLLSIGLLISTIMLLVAMVCGIMVRRMVGSGLIPLSSLARQVANIDESKLDLRLSRAGVQSIELARSKTKLTTCWKDCRQYLNAKDVFRRMWRTNCVRRWQNSGRCPKSARWSLMIVVKYWIFLMM